MSIEIVEVGYDEKGYFANPENSRGLLGMLSLYKYIMSSAFIYEGFMNL
mgnify:CR=1 FL=1